MTGTTMPEEPSAYTGILRGTARYAFAILVSKMASFVMLPVYTRYLSPADYGVLELLSLASFVVSALVFMRIGDTLAYYYSTALSAESREETVCTIFMTAVGLGACCGVAGWVGAEAISRLVFQTPSYAKCVTISFAALALSFPVELGFSYLRVLDKTGVYIAVSIGSLLLAIICNVIMLAGFHLGMYAMLWSSLIVAAATAAVILGGALRGIDIRRRFRWPLMLEFIRYSLPLAGSGVATFVMNFADRFFLQRSVSLTEVGIYALAYKLGMLVAYFQTPFETYWRAQMFQIIKRSGGEQVYIHLVTYLTTVMSFAMLLFIVFATPAVRVIATAQYGEAARYVPWIAATYVMRALTSQFRSVFMLEGRPNNEFLVAGAGGAVCLAGYALLIPRFLLWGAVASTFMGFLLMMMLAFHRGQKVRRFAFEYRRIVGSAALAVALALPVWALHPASWWAQVGLGCVLSIAYPLCLKLIGFFHETEWAYIRRQAIYGWRFVLKRAGPDAAAAIAAE